MDSCCFWKSTVTLLVLNLEYDLITRSMVPWLIAVAEMVQNKWAHVFYEERSQLSPQSQCWEIWDNVGFDVSQTTDHHGESSLVATSIGNFMPSFYIDIIIHPCHTCHVGWAKIC